MRTLIIVLGVLLLTPITPALGAGCVGAANCKVCSNCSRCKHCKSGGTCGAKSGGSRLPESRPPLRKTAPHMNPSPYIVPAPPPTPPAPITATPKPPQQLERTRIVVRRVTIKTDLDFKAPQGTLTAKAGTKLLLVEEKPTGMLTLQYGGSKADIDRKLTDIDDAQPVTRY